MLNTCTWLATGHGRIDAETLPDSRGWLDSRTNYREPGAICQGQERGGVRPTFVMLGCFLQGLASRRRARDRRTAALGVSCPELFPTAGPPECA